MVYLAFAVWVGWFLLICLWLVRCLLLLCSCCSVMCFCFMLPLTGVAFGLFSL